MNSVCVLNILFFASEYFTSAANVILEVDIRIFINLLEMWKADCDTFIYLDMIFFFVTVKCSIGYNAKLERCDMSSWKVIVVAAVFFFQSRQQNCSLRIAHSVFLAAVVTRHAEIS